MRRRDLTRLPVRHRLSATERASASRNGFAMSHHKQSVSVEGGDGYGLQPSQVPDFPGALAWADQLRWCVAVMDADDRDIGFAASLLSYAIDRGGLTEKQARHAFRLVERIRSLWLADRLDCQCSDGPAPAASYSLSDMDTKGSA